MKDIKTMLIPKPIIFQAACLLFLLRIPALAQDYAWPTDASRIITSSFAEYRGGRFHAGLDFRTWGRDGYKTFAIESGSAVRLRVSPTGYGKAVYLLLDNGKTVVYGHLSRFTDELEPYILERQRQTGKYTVDIHLPAQKVRFNKGDIVGYTGSSGDVPPHLHMEIRDRHNRLVNPFLYGFAVADQAPPTITAISFRPLEFGSHVEGDYLPHIVAVQSTGHGRAVLADTVRCRGTIGLGMAAFDRTDGARNPLSIYMARFFIDDSLVYSIRYDRFSFNENHLAHLDLDFELIMTGQGRFHRLYRAAGNTLSFYEPDYDGAGRLVFTGNRNDDMPAYHHIRIEAEDFFQNRTTLTGVLQIMRAEELPPVRLNTEIQMMPALLNEEPDIQISKRIYGQVIRLELTSGRPWAEKPVLLHYYNSHRIEDIPLRQKDANTYAGSVFYSPNPAHPFICELRFWEGENKYFIKRDTTVFSLITPENGGAILSPDGVWQLRFPSNAVFEPTLAYGVPGSLDSEHAVINQTFSCFPDHLFLKGRGRLSVNLDEYDENLNQLGVYTWADDKRSGLAGLFDSVPDVWISRMNRFAVLRDTIPPEIHSIYPGQGVRVQSSVSEISVIFEDTLSGVGGEDDYFIILNGQPLIVKRIPSRNQLIGRIDKELNTGLNVIEVMIRDRAGNIAERRQNFHFTGHSF